MESRSPLTPPTNHVFLDFENVQEVDLSLIGARSVCFTLMVGAKQTKLDSDLVEKLMAHSTSVQLVRLKSSGKNALDFALAYHLGRTVLADPTGHFHIVSKDAGFDPLIEHLRERNVQIERHGGCAELGFGWPGKNPPDKKPVTQQPVAGKTPSSKTASKTVAKKKAARPEGGGKLGTQAAENGYQRVWAHFTKNSKHLPARRKSLQAKIGNLIDADAGGEEVAWVIQRLENACVLEFDKDDRPIYRF